MNKGKWIAIAVSLAVSIAVIIGALSLSSPKSPLKHPVTWMIDHPVAGLVIAGVLYIVASTLFDRLILKFWSSGDSKDK